MLNFYCNHCQKKFRAKGKTEEWNDVIYGPCKKKVAICPACTRKADEHRIPKKKKASLKTTFPSSSCATGNCPFIS